MADYLCHRLFSMMSRTTNDNAMRKTITPAPTRMAPYLRVLPLPSLLAEMLSVKGRFGCVKRDLREPNMNNRQGIKGIGIDVC